MSCLHPTPLLSFNIPSCLSVFFLSYTHPSQCLILSFSIVYSSSSSLYRTILLVPALVSPLCSFLPASDGHRHCVLWNVYALWHNTLGTACLHFLSRPTKNLLSSEGVTEVFVTEYRLGTLNNQTLAFPPQQPHKLTLLNLFSAARRNSCRRKTYGKMNT